MGPSFLRGSPTGRGLGDHTRLLLRCQEVLAREWCMGEPPDPVEGRGGSVSVDRAQCSSTPVACAAPAPIAVFRLAPTAIGAARRVPAGADRRVPITAATDRYAPILAGARPAGRGRRGEAGARPVRGRRGRREAGARPCSQNPLHRLISTDLGRRKPTGPGGAARKGQIHAQPAAGSPAARPNPARRGQICCVPVWRYGFGPGGHLGRGGHLGPGGHLGSGGPLGDPGRGCQPPVPGTTVTPSCRRC